MDALLTPQLKQFSHVIVNNRHYYKIREERIDAARTDSKKRADRTDFQLRSRERENTLSEGKIQQKFG